MNWTSLDLCAGAAGGWTLGLHRAGITTIAACEAVDWRRAYYAANFPGVKLYDDVRTLTGERIRTDLGRVPDIIAASFPCPEYSEINQRGKGIDGDDLFLDGVRLVDDLRPSWFTAENSPRLKSRGYDRIAAALEAIGYTCWPYVVGIGSAGGAHKRKRTFLLATDLSRPQGRPARQSRSNVGMAAHVPEISRWAGARGADGPEADYGDQGIAGLAEQRLGSTGSERLGRHLREYDGLPTRLAERCREAYGDAVSPRLTEAVGRAVLQVEAMLREASTTPPSPREPTDRSEERL